MSSLAGLTAGPQRLLKGTTSEESVDDEELTKAALAHDELCPVIIASVMHQ